MTSRISPYSNLGRISYINYVSKELNRIQPDILVIFCTFALPVLFKLRRRPKFVIYYNIEMAEAYGRQDQSFNRHLDGKVDLLIYPEQNRAMIDIRQYGYHGIPFAVVYNCANAKVDQTIRFSQRNKKVIYQGTLDLDNTNAAFFMGSQLEEYQIDIYGNLAGRHVEDLASGYAKLNGRVRYLGYIDHALLSRIRKQYAFGIVMWTPVNDNQYYAAPNKLFEYIADGVVPICTPHPQCVEIIERYQCGFLIPDWSYESFCGTIKKAVSCYNTGRYKLLVDNCRKAVEAELNWEAQMEKVKPFLIKI
jgi:glycosyltransferase involved in cell wall biosynthesis